MYLAFVDVVKAFDAVNRELLFIIICKLGCDLFNLSRLKVKSGVLTEFIREVQYADDIAIFSDTPEGLQSLLTSYNDVANRMGLCINTKKTETMCIGNMAEFFILRWYKVRQRSPASTTSAALLAVTAL